MSKKETNNPDTDTACPLSLEMPNKHNTSLHFVVVLF